MHEHEASKDRTRVTTSNAIMEISNDSVLFNGKAVKVGSVP